VSQCRIIGAAPYLSSELINCITLPRRLIEAGASDPPIEDKLGRRLSGVELPDMQWRFVFLLH
jgi:hypothetical protein